MLKYLAEKQIRYSFLLLSMISLFLLSSVLSEMRGGIVALDIIETIVLLAALLIWRELGKKQIVTIGIGCAAIACAWLDAISSADFVLFENIAFIGLFMSAFITVISDVLRRQQIDTEHVVGATAGYFILGFSWAYIFRLIFEFNSQCLIGTSWPRHPNIDDFLYFSFSTLSTVGYGDILPNLPLTRILSVLEAVSGQLYLTVLVGQIIGQYVSRRNIGTD